MWMWIVSDFRRAVEIIVDVMYVYTLCLAF